MAHTVEGSGIGREIDFQGSSGLATTGARRLVRSPTKNAGCVKVLSFPQLRTTARAIQDGGIAAQSTVLHYAAAMPSGLFKGVRRNFKGQYE